MLIIDSELIHRLAPISDLIEWMRDAMRITSQRKVELPLRRELVLPDELGKLGLMPGYVGGGVESVGVKLVSLVPPLRRKGSSHMGLMVLYDVDGLVPQAILCGATITAVRTSAVSAVATDALARSDSSVLAILGAGEQARAHARAMMNVRNFKELRVWGYDNDEARAFTKSMSENEGLDFAICESVEKAVAGADVVCTVTSAPEPILFGEMISPGTHINLVGSSHRGAAEADSTLVRLSKVFVDYRPSTMDQAAELLAAIEEGVVTEDHILGELGEVLDSTVPGRSAASDVTVYKSVGVATQDIVTARRIYERAVDQALGFQISV